ncbi:hypothetical protein H5A20_13610 [Pectobacterium brasiliense]|uniref:hypothetical protein n=1 Tax=Pectobacterium brasiliense TaxID=180957 RepID=UPI001968E6F7|nr:hypothetical protein [Pectobacterium brasiliense]MBN3199741.1 hypothetical protein [Pectobacterium brasiliense]
MKLDNFALYEILKRRGVSHFYHANTVATSITFLEEGGLLSRGSIEKEDLIQTRQSSDEDDKEFDVWSDVFIDIVDLHGLFPRQNLYGPVLFKFNTDLLLGDNLDIWITKNNPIYWNSQTQKQDKYFQSIKELKKNWDNYPIQQKMFTVRKPGKPILFKYLEEIILDNPKVIIGDDVFLYEEAMNALKRATKGSPALRKKIIMRECTNCFCRSNYLNQVSTKELGKLFLPVCHPDFNLG